MRSGVKITGKDYSVYDAASVELGLRLWTEAVVQALPRMVPQGEPGATGNGRYVTNYGIHNNKGRT